MEKTKTLIQWRGVLLLAAIWIYAEEDPIPRLTQSNPKRLRRLSAAFIATALMLVAAAAPSLAASTPSDLGASKDASLPGGMLEAVREALGPSARAVVPATQRAKLTAANPAQGDLFGISVAISGGTVVVGVPNDDDDGFNSGSAYVFTRSGTNWNQQSKLTASDAAAGDQFGFRVAIDGETIVVSAVGDDDAGPSSGSAYVFTRSGTDWTQQAKLTPPSPAAGDGFGISVAIFGQTAVVGAYHDDDDGTDSGSAFVFTRRGTNWNQQSKLTASDAKELELFGRSVAISGQTVVVGAPVELCHDLPGGGSAYVFTRSGTTWTEQAKLKASDTAADDEFGREVAISGGTVVVGALRHDDPDPDSGSGYVFSRSGTTWTEQAELTASDAAADDQFGFSVAIAGQTVVVGVRSEDPDLGGGPLLSAGSAYLFTRSGTTWTEQVKLTASDADAGDQFGFSVATSGNAVVIGAIGDRDAGFSTGSAYVFTR